MTGAVRRARIWGVIPAAGLSRRMGCPKQLLPHESSTLVGAVAGKLLEAGASGVVVVTRSELVERLRLPADPRVRVALNDRSDSEMIDSIRIGLAALDHLQPDGEDGVLVVPGDMPAVDTQSCRACVAAYVANRGHIIVATHEGRRGHPIVFPFGMRGLLSRLKGGLRMLPHTYSEQTRFVEVDDPGALLDVNTPRDYEHLGGQT